MSRKYLRVDIEGPVVGSDETIYSELDGDETERQLEDIAAEVFNNYASYGFRIVDESEVPEDGR